jgi:hypothetical protein
MDMTADMDPFDIEELMPKGRSIKRVSSNDVYDATMEAMDEKAPGTSRQLRDAILEELRDEELSKEEIQQAIRLTEFVIENEESYPDVRTALIEKELADEDDLPEQFDKAYLGAMLVALQTLAREQRPTPKEPVGMASGGLASIAQELSRAGRNGDTMLAHITPDEARMLKAQGGSGTINPVTGLPEFFKKLFKKVGKAIKKVVSSPIGRIISTVGLTMLGAPMLAGFGIGVSGTAAIVSGGLTAASGGDLKDVLKSAALAYGGSEVFQALSGAPAAGTPGALPTPDPTTGLLPGEAGIQQILSGQGTGSVGAMTPAATAEAFRSGAAGAQFGISDPYIASELAGSAPSTWTPPTLWDKTKEFVTSPMGRIATGLGTSALLSAVPNKPKGPAGIETLGWSGEIPQYTAVRQRVPYQDSTSGIAATRRPGSAGRRYFTDTMYVPHATGENASAETASRIAAAQQTAAQQAQELAKPRYAAAGGLMSLAKGRYLNGTTDGMEDEVPADIDGKQPARLSHGEFVIPADVVSHLGNGNSQAGAKRLYEMMDKIRHARTGTKKQGKQINADKYLPV